MTENTLVFNASTFTLGTPLIVNPTYNFTMDNRGISDNVKPLQKYPQGLNILETTVGTVQDASYRLADRLGLERTNPLTLTPESTIKPIRTDVLFRNPEPTRVPISYRVKTNTELLTEINTFPDGVRKNTPIDDSEHRRKEIIATYESMLKEAGKFSGSLFKERRLDAERFLQHNDPQLFQSIYHPRNEANLQSKSLLAERNQIEMQRQSLQNDADASARAVAERLAELESITNQSITSREIARQEALNRLIEDPEDIKVDDINSLRESRLQTEPENDGLQPSANRAIAEADSAFQQQVDELERRMGEIYIKREEKSPSPEREPVPPLERATKYSFFSDDDVKGGMDAEWVEGNKQDLQSAAIRLNQRLPPYNPNGFGFENAKNNEQRTQFLYNILGSLGYSAEDARNIAMEELRMTGRFQKMKPLAKKIRRKYKR